MVGMGGHGMVFELFVLSIVTQILTVATGSHRGDISAVDLE